MQRVILSIFLLTILPSPVYAARLSEGYFLTLREHVLERLNKSRAEHDLSPLLYSENIERVAQGHADDMALHLDPTNVKTRQETYLAHISSDGRALNARYRDAEVDTGWQFGENVGYWIREPYGDTLNSSRFGINLMHEGMMAEVPPNDAHRENILGDYSHVGIGIALLRKPGSPLNAVFLVTNFSRYQSEEKERVYREERLHNAARTLVASMRPPHGGPFFDVRPDDKYATAITTMKKEGIILGNPDGTFQPTKTVNRAESLKMFMDTIEFSPIGLEFNACFSDIFNQWFAPYVCVAKRKGWVKGYPDNSFRPAQIVNRAEAIALAVRVLDLSGSIAKPPLFDDAPSNAWFSRPLQILANKNALPFDGAFLFPQQGMRRDEMAEMLYRLIPQKEEYEEEELHGPKRVLSGQ